MKKIELHDKTGYIAAFGCFRGMHKGHLEVIKRVKEESIKKGLGSLVISHVQSEKIYATECEKRYLIKDIGIDSFISVEEPITPSLLKKLDVEAVVIGDVCNNLSFCNELESIGIEVLKINPVRDENGIIITDEMIESAFYEEDFERYEKLCGHKYIMVGEVIHGKAIGRTVGMPTANLSVLKEKVRPGEGVYGANVIVNGAMHIAVANIGKRPTVDDFDYTSIEAFILDFDEDIYGEEIVIEIFKKIRPVIKFENLQAVKNQVDKDVKFIREYRHWQRG